MLGLRQRSRPPYLVFSYETCFILSVFLSVPVLKKKKKCAEKCVAREVRSDAAQRGVCAGSGALRNAKTKTHDALLPFFDVFCLPAIAY